jgi:DNA-binding response OmpR family regulator
MRRGVNERPTLSIGDLAIDLLSRRVTVAGTAVELTTREFELLVYLADRSMKLIHTIRAVGFMLGEGEP